MKKDFKSLRELHQYYAIHNNCPLKDIATQPVYEISVPSSGILFIGEAPGRNEDKEGKPFVGSAGKFLDELLSTIDMTRDEVYVSNIVKYRPPNNRDPKEEEKDSCRVWLNAELIYIKPKVIVTLVVNADSKDTPSIIFLILLLLYLEPPVEFNVNGLNNSISLSVGQIGWNGLSIDAPPLPTENQFGNHSCCCV